MMPLQCSARAAEARAFQVKLIYIYRTKVAYMSNKSLVTLMHRIAAVTYPCKVIVCRTWDKRA